MAVSSKGKGKGKGKGKRIAVSSSLTAMGTHVPYRITQCYLPPGRGDIPECQCTWYWYLSLH